mgnify:CR=1 FL=1
MTRAQNIMERADQFFIAGEWVPANASRHLDVVNPATEEAICKVALGSAADLDKAVAAAREAFEAYSQTSVADRQALLNRIVEVYKSRFNEMGETISMEMGAPISFATRFQACLLYTSDAADDLYTV